MPVKRPSSSSGAPAPRRDARQPRRDTRRTILAAAIACVERDGITGASMEAIAETAGLSRPAVYYHFTDRRDLIAAVLVEVGARIVDQIRAETAFKPATLELVITASARMVELSLDDPVARQLARPESEELMADLLHAEEMFAVQRGFWAPLLEAAMAAGEVRDDLSVDDIVNWLIFVQLSLANVGDAFGLAGPGRLRTSLERFVAPALGSVTVR